MNKYQEALQKIASLIYEASKETSNAEDCEEYLENTHKKPPSALALG